MKVFLIVVAAIVFVVFGVFPFLVREAPVWASTWTSTFIALFLGAIALFQDRLRDWLQRPELRIDLRLEPPDCHMTGFGGSPDSPGSVKCYYFRLRIANNGRSVAKDVEVIAEELFKSVADGSFQQDNAFLPLNYKWSHFGGIEKNIQPFGVYKFCDFGFILHPTAPRLSIKEGIVFPLHDQKLLFWFDFAIQPNAKPNYLMPGKYRVKITATASNCPKVSKDFMLSWSGNWHDDDRNMLGREIVIKPI